MTPILIVDIGRILFVGLVEEVPRHEAMIPVFGAGLDGPFELDLGDGPERHRTRIVAAHVPRTVRSFGTRLAVMPFDPTCTPLVAMDEARALGALERLVEGYDDEAWKTLGDAVGLQNSVDAFPEKLRAATKIISANSDENLPVGAIANEVGLSVSRLQHLFKLHLGTSMRTYRVWRRFKTVAGAIAAGCGFTEAALEAGFFDAPHFNTAFRQAFGVPPSFVFANSVCITVVEDEALGPPS